MKYEAMPVAARAAFWFTASSIVQRAVAMITMPIFTRLMTTEQYGLYSLYGSWIQVLTVLTTLRLTWAVFNKGMSKYPEDRDSYASTMQTVTTILTLVALTGYVIFKDVVNDATGLTTFITLAMFCEVLLTPAISFWMARERYDFHYRSMVAVSVLIVVGNALLGVVAVLLSEDKGTARIVSGIVVPAVIGAVLYARNLQRARTRFVPEYAKFALVFNLPLLPHYLSMYALDSADRIMVARMIGLGAAAQYGVAYSAGLVMKIVTDSIANAIVPWQYRKLERGDLEAVERQWYPVLLIGSGAVLMFIAVAPELIAVLGGAKYAEAVQVIPPVALSIVFTLAYTMFANVELHFDANKFMMYGSGVAAIANIALNWLLLPRFGYLAAAYVTLCCYLALALAHYFYLLHLVKGRGHGLRMLRPAKLLAMVLALMLLAGALAATYRWLVLRYTLVGAACLFLVANRRQIRLLFGRERR